MKILLSAIGCHPGSGSEGRVGWEAVKLISTLHECHVITHSKSRAAIEEYQSAGECSDVQFHYFGAPYRWHPNRAVARLQSWSIFIAWQRNLLSFARELHARFQFDLAHHLTFVTWRVPSPLWQLPIPFIWGPIGGAGQIPTNFLKIMPLSQLAFELLRSATGRATLATLGFRRCVQRSAIVVAANLETRNLLAPYRREMPMAQLWPVFFDAQQIGSWLAVASQKPMNNGPLQLFAGGNLEARKGVALALQAMAELRNRGIIVRYTFGGWGPDLQSMRSLAKRLGIADQVIFHAGFSGHDYSEVLRESDVYFLPSLRESVGITLLEAVMAGCYPIVADASAPAEIVRKAGGSVARTSTPAHTVSDLVEAVTWCDRNRPAMRAAALEAGKRIASIFHINNYRSTIESIYQMAWDIHGGKPMAQQ